MALSLGSPPVAVSDHPALWSSDFPPARKTDQRSSDPLQHLKITIEAYLYCILVYFSSIIKQGNSNDSIRMSKTFRILIFVFLIRSRFRIWNFGIRNIRVLHQWLHWPVCPLSDSYFCLHVPRYNSQSGTVIFSRHSSASLDSHFLLYMYR